MKKYMYQITRKIYIIFLFFSMYFLISNQAFADPYYWGCTKYNFMTGKCIEYGFKEIPELMDLCTDDTLTLFARIPDGASCSYQWYVFYEVKPGIYFDGPIIGATKNKYATNFSGSKTYTCKYTCNGGSEVTTNSVTIRRNEAPEISTNLVTKNTCDKDFVTFTIGVSGYNNYEWSVTPDGINWNVIEGVISSNYSFTADLGKNGYQYKCYISNVCGSVTSSVASLNVKPLPDLDLGSDTHICDGEDLIINATSETDITEYLWSTLETSSSITVNETGNYSVTVTGVNGCKNSDTVIVTVDPNLTPVNLGIDKRVCLGETVTLDAGGGYDHYNWSTGDLSQSININETGDYSVEVTKDNNVCLEGDEIYIDVAKPFPDEKICVVTIDSASGKNIIVWEKTPDKGIVSYNIYRETNIGVYEKIGTVDVNSLSVFTDPTALPEQRTYLYRITIVDTCGNELEKANTTYHSPNFLQYVSSDKGINLVWTGYTIEGMTDMSDYLVTYMIYRGTDSTELSEYHNAGSIKNFTDTDPDALLRKYYYRVVSVLKDPCNPIADIKAGSGPYSQSMSNLEDNRFLTGQMKIRSEKQILTIDPNPFNESAILRFSNPDSKKYTLFIMDLSGKICRIEENINTSQYIIERKNLMPGIYFLELRGSSVIRGKVIVE